MSSTDVEWTNAKHATTRNVINQTNDIIARRRLSINNKRSILKRNWMNSFGGRSKRRPERVLPFDRMERIHENYWLNWHFRTIEWQILFFCFSADMTTVMTLLKCLFWFVCRRRLMADRCSVLMIVTESSFINLWLSEIQSHVKCSISKQQLKIIERRPLN